MKKDSIIKILSLSLGLTVGVTLIGKIFYELSYDSAYKDADKIYRIISKSGENDEFERVSGGVVPGFQSEIPGIESATRYSFGKYNEAFTDEYGNLYAINQEITADNSFFDVFYRNILAGNPKEVLADKAQVMISKSLANKMGDTGTVLGRTITGVEKPDQSYIIGGIFEDFAEYGSIKPDIIYSIETIDKENRENWIGAEHYWGFAKLKENVKPESLYEPIKKMVAQHVDIDAKRNLYNYDVTYDLIPITSYHLRNTKVRNTVIILSIIAFLLITISLLNYILISLSSLVKRSKEIGIRKCYGASRGTIFLMLLKESAIQLSVALCITGLLIWLGKDIIKEYTNYTFAQMLVPQSILAIISVIVLILLISVVIPTKIFMNIPVDQVVKGYSERSKNWKLALLGIQLMINIFMVSYLLIVTLQYKKVLKYNPGYETENIVYTDFLYFSGVNWSSLLNEIKRLPGVENVGICESLASRGTSGDRVFIPDGPKEEFIPVASFMGNTAEIFDIFGYNFIEGSKPTHTNEVAVSKKFVEIADNFAKWNGDILGKQILMPSMSEEPYTITGIYEDILLRNLTSPDTRASVMPFDEISNFKLWRYLVVKINPNTPTVIKDIQAVIKSQRPDKDYSVQDYFDSIRTSYSESLKLRNLLLIGGGFSIAIALLGLIGFINDEYLRRRKELAIRKINGANALDIFSIFAMPVFKLSLASGIVASVGGYVLGKDWLQQFSEKISLSPVIFIAALLIILAIAMIILIFNLFRMTHSHPADCLRTE